MTAREVVLEGGSPWGFRMHGGVDVQQPLRISRVNPGSKAAVKGVREGDVITSINNQPTRDITNTDAHLLLKNSGDTLRLGLNEDCRGSPRRRQFRTVQQQETRSESVEHSSSSKTSYSSTTTLSIKRSRPNSIDTENPPAPEPEEQHKIVRNGEPGNGVISQRSTLSSNSSSSPAASVAETQGTEARQEARDTTFIVDSKPVSADKKDVIADTDMGGSSRSHKRRSRASRKKNKPAKPVSDEMVEVPPVNDVPEPENAAENSASCAENAEVQSIAENRLLERVTNYRVESPETIKKQKKSNSNGVIKSKSLDDDDLVKITELSETSESEDNKVVECSAVVSEADSDVEWEVTQEFQDNPSDKGECLSTTTLPLEELESVHVTMISPEDEKNLRNFLEGLNLSTNPDDSSSQQKKESYKERKARKRAAIAEHFMPVLQFPRFLEVIREEGSDGSNGEAIATTERVVVVGGKLTETTNVQGTCSTSTVETSSAEVVYIDDSSTSKTPSDVSDAEGDDEASKSEHSHYSSLQELSADPEKSGKDTANPDTSVQETDKVLPPPLQLTPPPSQLTPPPTPDLSTPKNETVCDINKNITSYLSKENHEYTRTVDDIHLKENPPISVSPCEEAFNKEFKGFCEELNLQDPCKYVNALSPTRSSSVSSESSSKTNSQCTVRYNPMNSSIGDVADFLNDAEGKKLTYPDSLRELCLKELMSLPFGADVLEELAEVSQSIQELTSNWQERINPLLGKHFPAPCKQPFINTSFPLPAKKEETKWVGLPTQQDPKVLVCLSPTQKSYLDSVKKVADEAGRLLDLHEKFHTRRGYHEEVESKNARGLSVQQENAAKTGKFTNRLLAIIRETSDDSRQLSGEGNSSKQEENNSGEFKMQNLSEWFRLREKSTSAPSLAKAEFSTESYQKWPNGRTRDSQGYYSNRRHSLPHEICQQQIEYIRERERELQEEIEKLEKEKRKVIAEMASHEMEQYHISKTGDIAIRNDGQPSGLMPSTEFFRQKMYDEYMKQVAAREERKIQKVIKITSSKTTTEEESNSLCEVQHVTGIENEFMDKVKERMLKYGLISDDSEESVKMETNEENKEPVMLMDGDSLKDAKGLPKHLQEFVDITRQATNGEKSEEIVDIHKEATNGELEGVWSPGQRPTEFKPKDEPRDEKDEPIPPVWTPRSAGSSPTAERKEFRPVNFESPVLGRKNKPKQETTTPESPSVQPSWQAPEGSGDSRVAPSASLERRIPTSRSSPATGFTEFSTPRLPRAQNPTITLLQKAREGQLPKGASYIQTETQHPSRAHEDRPPLIGPGEVVYQIKKDYASDDERARRMVDLRPKIYEIGIGPTTQDGMPLVLRSEVKESNQSKWYKKMYDTIHKQKPDPRYPYSSGYFSEPEHNAFGADFYDSDGTVSDGKYTTLDRRRVPQPTPRDKENDYMSSTIPRDRDITHSEIIRHGHDVYKNQPGRIENYVPGRSSISEKEAKEWWDEVMDIFDGWLDDHSALPSYNYLLSRAITRSHLEQQKNVPQQRGYMSQALKESGYESDSTLVFRRREDAVQQLSPLEQREVYKNIQKGGDVPLHGLRKPAPERPKENAEIEYFPISPTLTRIRIHKNKPQDQVLCYPVTVSPHPRHVFAEYKRSAPSSASVSTISKPSTPPSPPKRRSSRNNNTLRLISTMAIRTEKSPSSRRHETCFTSTSDINRNKVTYLKDKITCKLSPLVKRKNENEARRFKVMKTPNVASSSKTNITPTLSTSKGTVSKLSGRSNLSKDHSSSSRSLSSSPIGKTSKPVTHSIPKKATAPKPKPGTFGSEKRKVDLTLPRSSTYKTNTTSTDLLSPTEVKKAVISQINSLPSGTTYKKTHALYSSVKNGSIPSKDKSLPIQVGISQRGKELLKPLRICSSLPSTPVLSRQIRSRTTTPSPCLSEKSSLKSQSASLDSLKSLKMLRKDATKSISLSSLQSKNGKSKTKESNGVKKLKKSRKDQLNGELAKREKKTKPKTDKPLKKSTKLETTSHVDQNTEEYPSENIYAITQDAIQKQREAIQTNSFFRHLFWRDIPSPQPTVIHQNSWVAEKMRALQRTSYISSEPTVGALKIYLNHTKPVTDSKFRSLDAALIRSRSASPKSVTWKLDKNVTKEEKIRSTSLPPKLIFTETSRPVSPILIRRPSPRLVRKFEPEISKPAKLVFTETSRPISPVIERKLRSDGKVGSEERIYAKKRADSPKIIFTETSRPVSPIVERRLHRRDDLKRERSASPLKLVFTETSQPVSPIIGERRKSRIQDFAVKKSTSTSKLFFTETSRPVSPLVARKRSSKIDLAHLESHIEDKDKHPSVTKLYFTETSRPVSPLLERRHVPDGSERSESPSVRQIYSRSNSPIVERTYITKDYRDRSYSPLTTLTVSTSVRAESPSNECRYKITRYDSEIPTQKLYFTETSRPVSPAVERKYLKEPDSQSPLPRRFLTEPGRSASPRERMQQKPEERSYSPTSKLFFSETSRPISPVVERKVFHPTSPAFRSPSSRRITQAKTSRVFEEFKRKPIRSHSAGEVEEFDDDAQSTSSFDISRKECKAHFVELLHSPRRCNRFKELNKFYSTLERMGELERTTSSSELRPRGKREEEIIDYDRWKEVHTRERAEKELETLYTKLKEDQRERGFLFLPKDVEAYRWKREFDRGLRIKDKSVENIKDSFEKLNEGSHQTHTIPDELLFKRELYKPLWRGSSVADLATHMVERRSQSEGRVAAIKKKMLESERLLNHVIGSRIWSSLSSEQINVLKSQLAEIYSSDVQHPPQPVDYSIDVSSSRKPYKPKLSVRRNSDELVRQRHLSESNQHSGLSSSFMLSEHEKKRLSQSLSREVMDRVSQRQKRKVSPSLVLGKETRGAIAAAEAKIKPAFSEVASPRTCYSLEMSEDEKEKKHKDSDFVLVLAKDDTDAHKNDINATMQEWAQPKKALVSTDVTNRVTSMSETESGSTDESTKTVVYVGSKDVLKKVEYFEQVAEEQPYTPTIYRAAENQIDGESTTDTQQELETCHSEEVRQPRKLVPSQSFQDLKELFGEQEQKKFSTLTAVRPPPPNSNSPNSLEKKESGDNLSEKIREPKMKPREIYHLKNEFEDSDEFGEVIISPRRSKSDPEINRKNKIVIPGQISGDVDALRRQYEYPWIYSGRGRSRVRRAGVVSPICFRAENRYMPHINIISKIASLYPKKTVFLSSVQHKSTEDLAKILGCPVGEVERLRQKFDSPDRNISLLGHMFTSSPNLHELRDIAPYLTGPWTAHKYPKMIDNTRSLSSPETAPSSWDTSSLRKDRPRPKSASPPRLKPKLSPILKSRRIPVQKNIPKANFDPKMHQPVGRYQPPCPKFEPVRYKSSWPQSRPSVTFKEAEAPTPPPKGQRGKDSSETESPRKYVENEVTIHYKTPVRQEVKESLSEEELSRRQAEHMKRVYEEERRRKYLQVSDSVNELQDMNSRRHTDNFIPSQKSPIPLNRYDDFPIDDSPKVKPRPRSPDLRLVARALYNFVGQSSRELTFRKGDVIYVRRQVDKNWYEGEHNAMVGLFPANYVEIMPYDGIKSTPRKPHEGHARAKFNFIAQTHLELSLAKGELVVVTRRVDDNWFEGRIGGRKGIFPVSYVEILVDPGAPPPPSKPVASPAAHSLLVNGSAGGKESMGSHSYLPSVPQQQQFTTSYRAKPVQVNSGGNYGSLSKSSNSLRNPLNEVLHIDTHSEPVPYRALYKYRPQNDDELELLEGDVVYVLEKCDDGWYVGSSQRTGAFGTFPGNYVERI